MMVPLDVRFESMQRDEKLMWEIDAQVAELESLFDSTIGCHVVLYGPASRMNQKGLFDVQIVLALPCREIRVERGAHRHRDVYVAVQSAFQAVRKQLEEWLAERHPANADCN